MLRVTAYGEEILWIWSGTDGSVYIECPKWGIEAVRGIYFEEPGPRLRGKDVEIHANGASIEVGNNKISLSGSEFDLDGETNIAGKLTRNGNDLYTGSMTFVQPSGNRKGLIFIDGLLTSVEDYGS